ncbi:MAG TPA: tetratricopeptide repeat protein [Rhodospirillaceae bacterium]|nr:tetratricopeptide repeat protein [Rhodospirillaceae bacterium]
MSHHLAGRYTLALSTYRKVLANQPGHAETQHLLGLALFQAGHAALAIPNIRRAITLDDAISQFHNNLAAVEASLGRQSVAVDEFLQALRLAPQDAECRSNLANALKVLGRLGEAERQCRLALIFHPASPEANCNLGAVLHLAGRVVEAAAALRRACTLLADFPQAQNNWASLRLGEGEIAGTLVLCRRILALRPDHRGAFSNLALALQHIRRLRQASDCYGRAVLLSAEIETFRNWLTCILYRHDLDKTEIGRIHREFGRICSIQAGRLPLGAAIRSPRLRIGYLSSDFRDHPVAASFWPALCHHDRHDFAIHCYADIASPDHATDLFRGKADVWTDINGLDDGAVAERIRGDGIDILVVLAGRFDRNRLQMAAWRAAPVQISLHDVATSGIAEMDYIIGDRWLLPRHGKEFFTERPLRLPQFYLGHLPQDLPEVDSLRRDGPAVFGCFNNPTKISAPTLGVWGSILKALPDSRLVLHYRDRYTCGLLREPIREALLAAGAQAEQLDFAQADQDPGTFLRRYNDIDVALDTWPFCGSTTTFQALVMGVPVVTWPQGSMAANWSESILRGLGLDQLVAASAEQYQGIAIDCAQRRREWREARRALRQKLANSHLCDARRWTGHLERIYRAVWRRACHG